MLKLKNLLTEAPTDDVAGIYGKSQRGGSVAVGATKLKKIIGDPKVQAVLKGGLADGDPNDDKLPYTRANIPVGDLKPTQKEIGFDQSVLNNLTDQYGSLKSFFTGTANVGGPIVTYAGEYIIDGHHRWSQVFAANPKAKMFALDIKAKSGFSHTDVLKAVHAAIAADTGQVPSANPLGNNLLKGTSIDQIPIEKLTPQAFQIWKAASPVTAGTGKQEINTPEDVQKAIFANLELMIQRGFATGAPGRRHMPQSDSGGNPIDRLGDLAKGTINIEEPFVGPGVYGEGRIKLKSLLGK